MRIAAGRTLATAAAALLGLAAAGLIACSDDPEAKPKPRAQVLVFSKTAGFRHDSIPAGIAAIRSLGRANGFSVRATENAKGFTAKRLNRFDAVVFLSTTGDVLAPKQQKALKGYIRKGGGWAGVHSAADTEYDWPFYGRLLGAYFLQHPAIQPAAIDVTDRSHPSTRPLPARWSRTDEWYDFRSNPRGTVHVLATLDESTYSGGTMGADHPIAWCHPFRGGRAWYTAGGHTSESYSEPAFRRHLLGGILWAAGLAKGDCRA
jgi:type 1 glutamine amidotransferase